jgi:hypothetical protein
MTAAALPEPGRTTTWQRDLMLVGLPALAVFAFSIASQSIFTDGDTNWQVAAGRWILTNHSVPRVDPFSYTMAGRPWVTHEWGAEAVLAAAYEFGGWAGVMVATGSAAAAAFAIVAAAIAPRLGALSVITALGLGFALFEPLLLARPHVIALPLLAVWLARLLELRRARRAPPLWMAGVMLVWANLHGSYIFGLAFAAAFAIEAVLEARTGRSAVAVRWGGFMVAATLAAGITPNGVAGLLFPFRVLAMSSLGEIGEWRQVDFSKPGPFEIAMMFTLFVLIYRGVRMGAVRLALLLVLVHMSLQHLRQEAILAIAAPLLIAEPLGRILEPQRSAAPPLPAWPLREIAAPVAVIFVLCVGLAGWRLVRPVTREDRPTVPVTALAHVPIDVATKPVLNDYSFGGWLIFNGVRPFIDGRADMYGDAFLQRYLKVERDADPGAVAATLAEWKIAWTILTPHSRLAALLDRTPGWRRLYADKWAVVQVRDAASPLVGAR